MKRWAVWGTALAAGWGALWLARPGSEPAPPSPSLSPSAGILGKLPLDLHREYLCPPDVQYAAYSLGRLFYGPTHPSHPDLTLRPERCFHTSAEAQLAGYTEAAPPLRDREVAGIFLEPAPRDLIRQCRWAAGQLGFAVPCPQLVPRNTPNTDRAISADPLGRLFVFQQERFAVPPEDPQFRDIVHGGHLLLIAYRNRDAQRVRRDYSGFFCPPGGKGGTKYVGSALVGDVPAFLEVCQRTARGDDFSLLDGHVIMEWTTRGTTYQLSVHGQSLDHQELLRYLGSLLEYVSPA